VEGTKTDPNDNGKNKAIMNGISPSPSKNRVPCAPKKVLPNDLPPHFQIPGPHNVVEYLAKVPTHMKLLNALRTLSQFEKLSCVLQAPPTSKIEQRDPLSKRPPLN